MDHLQARYGPAVITVPDVGALISNPYFDPATGNNQVVDLMQQGLLVVAPVNARIVELRACLGHESRGRLSDAEINSRAAAMAFHEENGETADVIYLTFAIDITLDDVPQVLYEVPAPGNPMP
jgi:hypothetical protein